MARKFSLQLFNKLREASSILLYLLALCLFKFGYLGLNGLQLVLHRIMLHHSIDHYLQLESVFSTKLLSQLSSHHLSNHGSISSHLLGSSSRIVTISTKKIKWLSRRLDSSNQWHYECSCPRCKDNEDHGQGPTACSSSYSSGLEDLIKSSHSSSSAWTVGVNILCTDALASLAGLFGIASMDADLQ